MTKAIAEISHDFTQDQISLIKATVAKNATAEEFKLFLLRCKQKGLNPLEPGQIYFVKYGSSPGTIVIGVDGFRSIAASTGKHTGTQRGIIRDETGKCIGGWAEVYRSDWSKPAREEVSLSEYNTGKAMWQKMPETMIKKVAEAAALRIAFPNELGGLYSADEMEQAAPKERNVDTAPQVTHTEGKNLDNYVIPFGKYKGLTLGTINRSDLSNYIDYIQNKALEENKEITGNVAEFMDTAIEFLTSKDDMPPPKIDNTEEQTIN